MAFNYYITENGRIIKFGKQAFADFIPELYVLTKNPKQPWKRINGTPGPSLNFSPHKNLVIQSRDFPELQAFYYPAENNTDGVPFFTTKSMRNIRLIGIKPKSRSFTADKLDSTIINSSAKPETIKELIAGLKEYYSTMPKEQTSGAIGMLNIIKKPARKPPTLTTIEQLIAHAEKEIKRIDHWYKIGGKQKARNIAESLNKLKKHWGEYDSPVIAAHASGLVETLTQHRHTFFGHSIFKNTTTSYDAITEKCPNIAYNV